ncbi:MAG: valine--tRNA ligase [Oscillospiraceae bacterium]|nr:valine--tRNA ligase [Oscillospiraceae bacterium]
MLDKVYAPLDVEERIYKEWLSRGYFHAIIDKNKIPYTIVIPPPNITGQLHMGHALDNTIQDILIRWRRMQGYSALWMPGTDHASIATEAKIVEALEAEGISKNDLGRDAFLERAWEWKRLYGGRIVEQLKRLGCSCDWERERFTLDAGLSEAVIHVFVKLYEDGLIYKGERIINWCPGCKTSISDIEVEYREHSGQFWYLRYPVIGAGGDYLTVATTRPETMLGDTAVAVNPDDPRYSGYVGKKVMLPLMDREIPIIADAYVDSSLGSGAVKITPAHDPNDFEVGLRHGLPQIVVIDDAGFMNANAGAYGGLAREDARKQVVADLQAQGLIDKIEPHIYNIGECSRCQTIIEPIMSKQWFVKMKPLAEPAIASVKEGRTSFVPERFSKIYYNWMENIQDWCISRQLWWGHRIPAYYCDACGAVVVAEKDPGKCGACGGALKQDEDVLDTWFSSALWPFSTMGWPKETAEYKYFYPTDVLVTGYDIIFFWVARMIFSGVRHTGAEPFKHVYIHGMLRDEQGRKMSKSLGNGIDPMDIVDAYGADALRFALTIGNAPGNDLRFSEDKVKAARNFANKLWNASRYVITQLSNISSAAAVGFADAISSTAAVGVTATADAKTPAVARDQDLTSVDRWILSCLNECVREVTENMEKFELGIALQKIYDFIWDVFCDWYIEFAKPNLTQTSTATARSSTLLVLRYVLVQSLKMLHLFMPFITEEAYSALARCEGIEGEGELASMMAAAGQKDSVMVDEWPKYDARFVAKEQSENTSFVIEVIHSIRNMRSEMAVPPSRKISGAFVTSNKALACSLEEGRAYIERLAGLRTFEIKGDRAGTSVTDVALVAGGIEAFFPLGELVDISAEKKRLEKELAQLTGEIGRASQKLANQGFVSKAPAAVVEEEKRKLKAYEDARDKVAENLARLPGA